MPSFLLAKERRFLLGGLEGFSAQGFSTRVHCLSRVHAIIVLTGVLSGRVHMGGRSSGFLLIRRGGRRGQKACS